MVTATAWATAKVWVWVWVWEWVSAKPQLAERRKLPEPGPGSPTSGPASAHSSIAERPGQCGRCNVHQMATLGERLVAQVRSRGPMTFADFMETALFDPDDGYYTTRASLGFEGDYVTSADLGPAFGRSLARGVADLWVVMGKAPTWDLVEAGAGRGILMR